MSIAELLLRLGCSLVAWLVLFAHCLWVAALGAIDCGAGAAAWRVLFWWTPVVIAFCLLLRVGFAVPGVGRALRLPVVLVVPLLLLAARVVLRTLIAVNVDGGRICDLGPTLAQGWAPAQLATLVFIGGVLVRTWRRGAS